MPKIPPSLQANYVNLPDEKLREEIGEMHEKLVRLKEKMKADPQINDWKLKIREREAEVFRPDVKRLEMRLEAARSVAKMKGIQYE